MLAIQYSFNDGKSVEYCRSVIALPLINLFFKQSSYALSKGKEVKIWTPGNDGVCRAPFSHGEDYYIGGKFSYSSCDKSSY